MANEKNSFILYHEDIDWFTEHLSDTNAGKLIASIFKYEVYGEIPQDLPHDADIGFKQLKKKLDRNREKWIEAKERMSEGGKKGGLVTQERNRNKATLDDPKATLDDPKAFQAVNVNVNDTVKVNDTVTAKANVNDTAKANVNETDSVIRGKTAKQKSFCYDDILDVQKELRNPTDEDFEVLRKGKMAKLESRINGMGKAGG